MKSCTSCGGSFPLEAYYKDIRHSDGRMSRCMKCHKRTCYEWTQKNPDKERQKYKRFRAAHPGKRKSENAARRAAKLSQTPKWLSREQRLEMQAFYDNCPKGYDVDHIVPLRGKNVKGLHVPWNLQILPQGENRRKSNKIERM